MDINTSQYYTLQKPIAYATHKHWLIDRLKALIETKYQSLFYAVIVHGSFGTNELVEFSDFDGLLIVNDNHLDGTLLDDFKIESMKLIYKFDPLQHHGWFQISKSDLSNYPQNYLPHEILNFSKLIYPNESSFNMNISYDNSVVDYKNSLNHILGLIEQQMEINWKNERIYLLKSYLSKIMLLPSLYFSAEQSKGIFKKDSFNQVKNDFTIEEWQAIAKATSIRNDWDYKLNALQRFVMCKPNKVFRKITKHWMAPKIEAQLAEHLNTDFKASLLLFMNAIKSKL